MIRCASHPPASPRRLRSANCAMSRLRTARRRFQAENISALASAILASEPKNSRCTGAIVVMTADMRARQARQRLDLAGVIHSPFPARHNACSPDSARATAARPNDCCRRDGRRAFSPSLASANRNASLVPVLPTEPVTPITLARQARTGGGGKVAQRKRARSGTTSSGASSGNSPRRSAATTASPALQTAPRNEFVSVTAIALNGEKRVAWADRPGVDRDSGYGLRQHALAPGGHRRRHRLDGPKHARVHATAPVGCKGKL